MSLDSGERANVGRFNHFLIHLLGYGFTNSPADLMFPELTRCQARLQAVDTAANRRNTLPSCSLHSHGFLTHPLPLHAANTCSAPRASYSCHSALLSITQVQGPSTPSAESAHGCLWCGPWSGMQPPPRHPTHAHFSAPGTPSQHGGETGTDGHGEWEFPGN